MMHQMQLLKKYRLSVRGARGQHLLIDPNTQEKFASCVNPKAGEMIVEIGPGLGAITRFLLTSGAVVHAIEKDPRFCSVLTEEFSSYKNLKLKRGDILETDFTQFPSTSLKVVGNLPYYITSPILLQLIASRHVIDSAYLTVQTEIADRIFASPSTKQYGRLSILISFYANAKRLFDISRHCFTPKPKVDSTSISLTFKAPPKNPLPFSEKLFFDLVKAAFRERRKTITNSVTHGLLPHLAKSEVGALLETAGISSRMRAENLTLEDYMRLAEVITKKTGTV